MQVTLSIKRYYLNFEVVLSCPVRATVKITLTEIDNKVSAFDGTCSGFVNNAKC